MNTLHQSEHFTLHPLAEGVFAAIATEDGAGFSNAGLVDLGDQTLVFDAFENPQATEDLLTASLQLTHRNPAVVIISHFHPDHWGGLQVFAGSAILATHATRQRMIPILQALPTLKPTLPNQTFEGKIVFHGKQRSAELIATGKGHTESDCILSLPQDRITFIGDIGFFYSQPFMPYGFPLEWVALLEDMATWEVETFVPGHGPLGGKVDLAIEARYIRVIEDMVRRVAQDGGMVEDALRQTLPAPFDVWQAMGRRFEANVRASFERQCRSTNSPGNGNNGAK